jgi:ferredoxin
MQVCPTTALHPCFLEAGLEGMWTPRLVPKIGYCDYECTRCTQACPTEAIQPLGIQEKQEVRIGLASVDVTRCLPYAYGQTCLVCEEHCPVPDKAIYMVEGEVETHDGAVKTLKQPHVDPHLCIGCGVCENVCPFEDKAAIRVTSANETRNPDNQPILAAPGGGGFKAPAGSGGPSPNEGGGEEQAQSPYG